MILSFLIYAALIALSLIMAPWVKKFTGGHLPDLSSKEFFESNPTYARSHASVQRGALMIWFFLLPCLMIYAIPAIIRQRKLYVAKKKMLKALKELFTVLEKEIAPVLQVKEGDSPENAEAKRKLPEQLSKVKEALDKV